jgi:DNA-binding MarR family transcriptional regulator
MTTAAGVNEGFELVRLLNQARDATYKARQKELNEYGIHVRRGAVLSAVNALGDRATPVEIARWLIRERNSVSELLDKMERDGLVKKVRDLERKNRVRAVLTDKGRQAYNKVIGGESICKIMSSLTQEERQRLMSYLMTLRYVVLKECGIEHSALLLPSTDDHYSLYLLLIETADLVCKFRERDLSRFNITTRRSAILLSIQAIGDRATPVEIARWLIRERHSVSELLDKMERDGLVKKVRDLERKNRVRAILTDKGRQAYNKVIGGESIRKIMSSLTQEERQRLVSYLRTLKDTALKAI